jgi:hypothetical protein
MAFANEATKSSVFASGKSKLSAGSFLNIYGLLSIAAYDEYHEILG